MKQWFKIIGSGRALPTRRITSDDLDRRLGLKPGWTAQHTGVLVRHEASSPGECHALVRQVCVAALKEANLSWREVDLIVDASLSLQQPIPCNAALLQEILGPEAAGIPSIDVHASCLGFIAAVNVINGLFATGSARRALVVCAETPLQGVNWAEPESACLMGDGVAAILFEVNTREVRCAIGLETFAEGAHLCEVRGGGHRLAPFAYTPERQADFRFHMDGKAVHKLASRLLPPLLARLLAESGRRADELHIVPHQASGPALEFMRRRLELPLGKFHSTIAQHGNMVAAGIPYVLDGMRRGLGPGTPVMLIGTAAGYTQGAAIFEL